MRSILLPNENNPSLKLKQHWNSYSSKSDLHIWRQFSSQGTLNSTGKAVLFTNLAGIVNATVYKSEPIFTGLRHGKFSWFLTLQWTSTQSKHFGRMREGKILFIPCINFISKHNTLHTIKLIWKRPARRSFSPGLNVLIQDSEAIFCLAFNSISESTVWSTACSAHHKENIAVSHYANFLGQSAGVFTKEKPVGNDILVNFSTAHQYSLHVFK